MRPAEERWFEALEKLGTERLALELMDAGFRPNTAFGIARFVEGRKCRREDYLASDTRARYRRLLDELDPDTIGTDQFRGSSIAAA